MNLIYARAVEIASLPNPAELLELRSTRMALAELGLLALAGGLLGRVRGAAADRVLRPRRGHRHLPRLGARAGGGVQPAGGRARRRARATRAAWSAPGARGATRATPPPRCCWWPRSASGVILASDVFESSASVDGLLFGTAIGLEGADLAFSAVAAALAALGVALLGRIWTAVAFDPDGAAALGAGVAVGRRGAAGAGGGRRRGGAAGRRCAAGHLDLRRARRDRAALRGQRARSSRRSRPAWPPRRERSGCTCRCGSTCPGPRRGGARRRSATALAALWSAGR